MLGMQRLTNTQNHTMSKLLPEVHYPGYGTDMNIFVSVATIVYNSL